MSARAMPIGRVLERGAEALTGLGERGLGLEPLGDVADADHDAADGRVVEQVDGVALQPHERAVVAHGAHGERAPAATRPAARWRRRCSDPRLVVGVHERRPTRWPTSSDGGTPSICPVRRLAKEMTVSPSTITTPWARSSTTSRNRCSLLARSSRRWRSERCSAEFSAYDVSWLARTATPMPAISALRTPS